MLLSVCCCCVLLLLCVGVGCWCWCGYFGPSGSPLAPNPPADLPARTVLLWTTLRRTAQNFALFFPLPPPFLLFLSLSGCLLVDFWWCLKRRDRPMSTFGVLGLSCEAPAALKRRGSSGVFGVQGGFRFLVTNNRNRTKRK